MLLCFTDWFTCVLSSRWGYQFAALPPRSFIGRSPFHLLNIFSILGWTLCLALKDTLVSLTNFRQFSAPIFKLLWRAANHIFEVRYEKSVAVSSYTLWCSAIWIRWLLKMDDRTGIPLRRLWNDRQTQSTIIKPLLAHSSWPPWLPAKFPTSPLRATSSSLKACA